MCHYKDILELNDDVIFIADSHTKDNDTSLISMLQSLNPLPSQIVLLGDISHILVGNLKLSLESNKSLIDTLERLSKQTKIIYFEGNHDFNLSNAFSNIITIPRCKQPLLARFRDKNILLSHGDLFLDKKYEIYIKALTSKPISYVLQALSLLSFGKLYRLIHNLVQEKKITYAYNIKHLVESRIEAYKKYINLHNIQVDIVIEGHFHIGKIMQDSSFSYIAMPSFYYDKSYLKLADSSFKIYQNT